MYLSLLSLNPRNKIVQHELQQPYQMHRTIMNAFDTGGVKKPRNADDSHGVLFRLDEDIATHLPVAIVQSCSVPNWGWLLQEKDERQQPYLLQPVRSKEIQIEMKAGQCLAFRLRANPTKRISAGTGNKGKRMALLETDAQLNWLQRKFEKTTGEGGIECPSGFKLVRANVSRNVFLDSKKVEIVSNGSNDTQERVHDITLFAVQFDGVIEVLDPTFAQNTIQSGIGSGKAFGFGLLSVAAARG